MGEKHRTERQCDRTSSDGGNTRTDPDPDARGQQTSRPHSPALVLVVDDDPNVRASLGEVLTQEHYSVKLARDAREAARESLDSPPNLILLDINMPDITGWQACEILAQFYPSVPVMIITARPDQARRAADFGVNAFMEKPLDIPILLRTVRKLLADPESTHLTGILPVWPTNDLLGSQG